MRYFACILLPIFFTTATFAANEPGDPLLHLRKNHPRLLFTDKDLAAAVASAKADPLRAELNKCIIATAESILTRPPVRQPNNTDSEEQDRYAVYYIVNCAMAYRLTGDERFFARAKSDLLTVAAFSDWNPRHFLSVGEMSFAVAIGYDWLYAKLKPEERVIIKKALMEKSLSFADTTYGYVSGKAAWSGKETGNHNLPLHWVMVTRAKIDLAADGRSATLTHGGKKLRVELLQPAAATLSIGSTKPSDPRENQNEGTSMLKIDLNPKATDDVTRLAVLLTPVGDKWPKLNPPIIKSLAGW